MKKYFVITLLNIYITLILTNPAPLFAQNESSQGIKTFTFQNELLTSGIDLGVSLIADYFSNLSGGIQSEASFVNNVLLTAGFDMEKLAGINRLSFYLSTLGINGGAFLQNSGAIQGISNVAGANQWKVYEAWIEQSFINDKFALLFGLYDLNAEFDVRESSVVFANPSFGIGFDYAQTGKNGPSIFPHTSLALRLKVEVSKSLEILAAAFDGVPGSLDNEAGLHIKWNQDEGVLLTSEIIFSPQEKKYGKDYSKFSIGAWYYTSKFEKTDDGLKENGNSGIYVSGEQFIYSENSSTEQGLALFGRLGIANSSFNSSDFSIQAGFNYIGLIPGRDEDMLGLAFTSIHLSKEFRNIEQLDIKYETILELTYSFQLNEWLRLQPDFQYIFNPVLAPEAGYAFVAGVRTEISI